MSLVTFMLERLKQRLMYVVLDVQDCHSAFHDFLKLWNLLKSNARTIFSDPQSLPKQCCCADIWIMPHFFFQQIECSLLWSQLFQAARGML